MTATEHLDHLNLLVNTVLDTPTATTFRNALTPARKEVVTLQAFRRDALHEIALLKEKNLSLIAAYEKANAEKLQIAAELEEMKKRYPPSGHNRVGTPTGF